MFAKREKNGEKLYWSVFRVRNTAAIAAARQSCRMPPLIDCARQPFSPSHLLFSSTFRAARARARASFFLCVGFAARTMDNPSP